MVSEMSSSKSKTAMAKSSDLQVAGKGIDDEELRRKFLIPAHLSFAMVVATRARDSEIGAQVAKILEAKYEEETPVEPKAPVEPNAPLVVFVDCKGGGDRGPEIKVFLQNLISEDQVKRRTTFLQHFSRYYILEVLGAVGLNPPDEKEWRLC